MDIDQSKHAEDLVIEIRHRMGGRYSLSKKAILEFASSVALDEQVRFAEKVKYQHSDVMLFVKAMNPSIPAALVVTNRAIHILTKNGSNRYDICIATSYHLQYKESDEVEEVTIWLAKDDFAYLQIRRVYLDPLINALHSIGGTELEYQSTLTQANGDTYTAFDRQRLYKSKKGVDVTRVKQKISVVSEVRDPDVPKSFRAEMRKRLGRNFKYSVGEFDVVEQIVRPHA